MPCLQKNGAVTPQYRQRLCPAAQGRFFSCRIRSVGRAVVSKNHRPLVRIYPHENSILLQTENRQRISTLAVFLWARVDYASRASKKAPQGLFPRRTVRRVDAVRIHPPSLREGYYKTETPVSEPGTGVLGGAKQPKSEPLPSGASLAAISSKVMVLVPSL